MRIATWNIERLKHHKEVNQIMNEIGVCDADILVLTETDDRINPDYPYCFKTSYPLANETVSYRETENLVAIYSRFECVARHKTFNEKTSLCVELSTSKGDLLVYGTIMGVFGNRGFGFKEDVIHQMNDISRLCTLGKSLCVIGDYNLSFADGYYFTQYGRDLINSTFRMYDLLILTREQKECVDHIAVSSSFVKETDIIITEWNQRKKLSDHKGIMIEF